MAEVRLINVCKAFGKNLVVDRFTLDIADGEFIILVGPSGCGKSTTLRAIAGLEEISSGDIYIGDRLVNDVHPRSRDIAMVFQNYALYPHMNVYDNMAFCLKQQKMGKAEIDQIVRRTAQLLGMNELLDRKPGQLSGGQRQRVAVGRAIVRSPKVFLFDEPLSNLDAKLRIAMRAELLDLHQKLKTTTIYVTHDQLEAMTMGDRIVVMHRGCIQQVDPPQVVYDHPVNQYVAGFIGSPPMNFVDCRLVRENDALFAVTPGMRLLLPSDKRERVATYVEKEVVLGIRPEHIRDRLSARAETPQASFEASVWVVEPLGSEKLVHIRNEQDTIVARLGPQLRVKAGDRLEFVVNMELAHLFDKETGETIL